MGHGIIGHGMPCPIRGRDPCPFKPHPRFWLPLYLYSGVIGPLIGTGAASEGHFAVGVGGWTRDGHGMRGGVCKHTPMPWVPWGYSQRHGIQPHGILACHGCRGVAPVFI